MSSANTELINMYKYIISTQKENEIPVKITQIMKQNMKINMYYNTIKNITPFY
jgi:hypothetical protein